jgi:FMN phosphatase YigB (HAD superfamily)
VRTGTPKRDPLGEERPDTRNRARKEQSAMPETAAAILLPGVGVTLVPSPRYLQDERLEEIDAAGRVVLDEAAYWRRVRRRFTLDDAALGEVQAALAEKYCRNLNVWARLPALAKRARLVLIHAGPAALLPSWREQHGLDAVFSAYLVAGDLGLPPSEPAFYARAAERLELPPAAILAACDALEPFEAARAAGCLVYRYGTASGLIQTAATLPG